MKKIWSKIIFMVCLGIIMILGSLFLQQGKFQSLQGILIGGGAGVIGMAISKLVILRWEIKNPKEFKNLEVEYKDERSTMIRNKAKAKVADITQWLIMGIAFLTVLLDFNFWITITVVSFFLLYNIIEVYYMNKFNKEM